MALHLDRKSFAAPGFLMSLCVALAACGSGTDETLGVHVSGLAVHKFKVVSHNITGGGSPNFGAPEALNAVNAQIAKFSPDVVMLQEVCPSQVAAFKEQHPRWELRFEPLNLGHRGCGGQPQGNVLASRHGLWNESRTALGENDSDGSRAYRMLCADVGYPHGAAKVRACVVHLRYGFNEQEAAMRARQMKVIHRTLADDINQKNKAVVVAGDFNNTPRHYAMDTMYKLASGDDFRGPGNFYEADQRDSRICPASRNCRDGEATHDTGEGRRKIDYVFFSENRATGTFSLGTILAHRSHHKVVRAWATLDLTSGNARLAQPPDETVPDDPVDEPDPTISTPPIDEPPPPAPVGADNEYYRSVLGNSSWTVPAVSAPSDHRLNRIFFDARFYLNMYPDVAAAGGHSFSYAEYHWLHHGIVEGRIGSPTWDPVAYMENNPDVSAAFGWNNYVGALEHYWAHGRHEGRRASWFFTPGDYYNRYGDLQAAFGWNPGALLEHFLNFGMSEGRQASVEFAPAWYLGVNPDVQEAWGPNNYRAGMGHWLRHGRGEGRPGAP
jgi:endonuclease/exonuclease/phosphatase family metal-dependent hydrolase